MTSAARKGDGCIGGDGTLFIVSGPSGAGKTSISGAVLKEFPNIELSVSVTTRKPRPSPGDRQLYHFVDADVFQGMRESGQLAEWAEVYGNYYGTPNKPIEKALAEGRDILLDIDVQGAKKIKEIYGPRSVSIFLVPPDRRTLEDRLKGRGSDSPEVVTERLLNACREIRYFTSYDYIIVNHDLGSAYREFSAVIRAERRRVSRMGEAARAAILAAFDEAK